MVQASVNKDGRLVLPNEKVIFTYNPLAVKAVNGNMNHDGSFMYTESARSWDLPRLSDGRYIDVLKNEKEGVKEALEKELNLNLNQRDSEVI